MSPQREILNLFPRQFTKKLPSFRTPPLPMPRLPWERCQLPVRDLAAPGTHPDLGLGDEPVVRGRFLAPQQPVIPDPFRQRRTRGSSVPNRVQKKRTKSVAINQLHMAHGLGSKDAHPSCGVDGAPINALVLPASTRGPHPARLKRTKPPRSPQTSWPPQTERFLVKSNRPPAPACAPTHYGPRAPSSIGAIFFDKTPGWPRASAAPAPPPRKRPKPNTDSRSSDCRGP